MTDHITIPRALLEQAIDELLPISHSKTNAGHHQDGRRCSMTDREAFDVWALSPAPDSWWGLSERERLFLAWQAATAATQERCAQAVEELDRQKWFPSQRDFAEACVDAIRKGE